MSGGELQIDNKIDNGVFDSGMIKAINGYQSRAGSSWVTDLPVYTADSATSCINGGEYNVGYSENVCALSIRH